MECNNVLSGRVHVLHKEVSGLISGLSIHRNILNSRIGKESCVSDPQELLPVSVGFLG